MSKALRIARKKERKGQRGLRLKAFNKIIEVIGSFKDIDFDKSMTYKEKFNEVWPLMKPLIEFFIILRFTGDKFDSAAKKVILVGENMYKNESVDDVEVIDFLEKLAAIWEKIEFILEIIKFAVDDKKDEIIDKAIEVGEWIFDYEDENAL